MAKKNNKKAAVKAAPAKMAPVTNPDVDAAVKALKEGATPEKQNALSEALKKAKLLAPCSFDVPVEPDANGAFPQINPNQIKFYLVNTKDGKTLFPAFTDIDKSTKIAFTKDKKALEVVRTIADYDVLLNQPGATASGIVLNPGTDDIVVPKQLVARLAGRTEGTPVRTAAPQQQAPVRYTFSEPSIYPTRMINAVYDRCCDVPEISRVYMKQKTGGGTVSFFFIVEADVQEERILNEIREVAVPLAKDVAVEAVFITDQLKKVVIKESTALYDRELEL